MKKCIDCGLEKEITEFHLEKRNKDGHRNNCKVCRLKREREKYANRDICGFIPKNSSSTNATGANLFGVDYFEKYNRQNMVPLACGLWDSSTNAGVFARDFSGSRSLSHYRCGFRASAYFS